MKKRLIFLVLLVVFLWGCTKKDTKTPPPTQPVVEVMIEEDPPVVVYPDAVVDYLGQVTDFSWPQVSAPEMVMIHFCSAVMLDRNDPYNYDLVRSTFIDNEVSIHYLIDREGVVYCFIPEDRHAWHAGYGTWQDKELFQNNLNRFTIGIELMAIGSQEDMSIYLHEEEYNALNPDFIGYTDAQYEALKALVTDICRRNEIPMDRDHVIGHDEFSPTKNDPGQLFDWSRLIP